MKLKVRNKNEEDVIEFWLEEERGEINLMAQRGKGQSYCVAVITSEGLDRLTSIESLGLTVDGDGKIKLIR